MPLDLARGIAEWMRSCQERQAGRVVDSLHQRPGTYADGFAALVFSMLGWSGPRDLALAVSLQRPLTSEFDSLAQALLVKLSPETLDTQQLSTLQVRPLYRGQALVSNNWGLFRCLTRRLRGEQTPEEESFLKGQLPSGLFPDSPIGLATPVCYHAKICAVLALRLKLCSDFYEAKRLRAGLTALLQLVSPQGVLVPYGRSRNTLFGYASAYLALRLGASLFDDGELAWGAQRILQHMTLFQAPDGHLPAVLNRDEWMRRDWDIYINNPDYNAYAAACLLLAQRLAPNPPEPAAPATHCADLGPFLSCRHSLGFFACSTRGEYAPYGSPFFCDTRYAGLVPLLFDDGQRVQALDENYCWDGRESTRKALFDPRVSDWIPYVEQGPQLYWVRLHQRVGWSLEGDEVRVSGEGVPVCSLPNPRWRRFLATRLGCREIPQSRDRSLGHLLSTTLHFNFRTREIGLCSSFPKLGARFFRELLEARLCPT